MEACGRIWRRFVADLSDRIDGQEPPATAEPHGMETGAPCVPVGHRGEVDIGEDDMIDTESLEMLQSEE